MSLAGDVIFWVALAIAGVALTFDRHRACCLVFGYFLAYESLSWFLGWVNRLDMLAYAPLAVAIDMFFFYVFKSNGSRISALACGVSALYGGATLYGIYLDSLMFYSVYDSVAIGVSLVILADGANRAWRNKHYSIAGSDNLLDKAAGRLKALFARAAR